MHRLIRSFALLALVVPSLGAQGAPSVIVTAGHADVRGDRVPHGEWHVTVSLQGPQGAPASRAYEWSVTPITWQGRPALLSLQWSTAADGGHDSTIVDARTLAPIALRAHNPMMRDSLDWAGREATGAMVHQGTVMPTRVTLAEAAFDESTIDLVVVGLPLASDYRARLAVGERDHQTGGMGLQWLELEVVGAVDTPEGKAWDVRLKRAQGDVAMQVDQRTREVRRMSLSNSRGMRVSLERTRTK